MPTLVLLIGLLAPLQTLPGEAFARPSRPLVLHAAPGHGQPGVLELGPEDVLRTGDTRGAFVEVFVPQGFPVYLHGDFVDRDDEAMTAAPTAERVNVRLLPSTAGMVPVGQVGPEVGSLPLLDVEGGWVRVLAPTELALYAPADGLEAVPAGTATASWNRALAGRTQRLEGRRAAARYGRPGFLEDMRARLELELLSEEPLARLSDADLVALGERLEGLRPRVEEPGTRAVLDSLTAAVADEQEQRRMTSAARARAQARQAAEAESRLREAQALAAGLRFLGKGEALTASGRVTVARTADPALSVYAISDGRGREFKLTAAEEIADLEALVGKQVTLEGRSLSIVTVSGAVLVIDRVADVRD